MAIKKQNENKTILLALAGLFAIALLVIIAYSFSLPFLSLPMEGCVGLIEIKGPILTQDVPASLFSDELIGSETISEDIEEANKRPDVKSLLIVVDSPGGSVVASKQIYDSIRLLKKPSVAYINELATSGGYYVASGADYIISNPDAITGSIGARATFADMSGLFGKIGYNETTIKSGEMKDLGSPSRPMSPEEREIIQSIVDESFQQFKSDIIAKRGSRLDASGFSSALDARIMSGRQAKKIGLVDELGGKKAAIKKAAELGGIKSEKPRLCQLGSSMGKKGLFGSLSSQANQLIFDAMRIPRLSYQ
ncbi:MAG: signal peptide peptidase SppA [Candidatus Micrarchaeota archaeon]|nr:signal peptide peptidase SppA [Candidatus Micrarchaeota archaeon]